MIRERWWGAGLVRGGVVMWMLGIYRLDPDFGWHLKVGEILLTEGIPATDPFSYTMPSLPWVDHGRVTDMAMAWLYPRVGMTGLAGLAAGVGVAAGGVVGAGALRGGAGGAGGGGETVLGGEKVRMREVAKDLAVWGMSAAATGMNPYGFRLWEEVWLTVSDTNLRWNIAEWNPFFLNFELGFGMLAVWLVALWRVGGENFGWGKGGAG